MDDLCPKIDDVLKECSKILRSIEEENVSPFSYRVIFINFSNGPLLRFVKSIQIFFKVFKGQNLYSLYVCLSQVKKCLVMHEKSTSKDCTSPKYEKKVNIYLIKRIQKCFHKLKDFLRLLDKNDIDTQPGIFIDLMNSVLNHLDKRFELKHIKPKIDKILLQAITIAKVSDETDNLELTSSAKFVLKAMKNFEKIDIMETRDFFYFEYLSSSLSILERRINIAVLHQIYKIFNDPFCTARELLKLWGNAAHEKDMHDKISDLDKFADTIIQIGLFAVACCKNSDYVIRLKSSIASLELLDCDIIPAVFDFGPPITEKKQFLKFLINQWIKEISEIQHLLEKIVDPYAFVQNILEISTNTIKAIRKSDSEFEFDIYDKCLNEFSNLKKYMENIFASEISKKNEFFITYKEFDKAFIEYRSCLTFFENKSYDDINYSNVKKKLLIRSNDVLKTIKSVQTLIANVMKDKSLPDFQNTTYILSNTKKISDCYIPYENNDTNDFDLLFSTIKFQKTFYNTNEILDNLQTTTLKNQDFLDISSNSCVITDEDMVIMELTNTLDNIIDTHNKS